MTTTIVMSTSEISGLSHPTYNSAAARKKYVDDISGSSKTRYADSSNVHFRFQASSLSYASYKHSANTALHSFNTANYITSTNAILRFAGSSNVRFRFPGSANVNWTKITAISSGFDGRLDNLEDNDVFNHTLYSLSANLYNKTWVDAFSGNIDARIDAAGGTLAGSLAGNIGSNFTYGLSGLKFVSSQNISGGTIKNTTIYTSLITDSDRLSQPNSIKFSGDEIKFSCWNRHIMDIGGDDRRIHIRSGSIWGHRNSTILGYSIDPDLGIAINSPTSFTSGYWLQVWGGISGNSLTAHNISSVRLKSSILEISGSSAFSGQVILQANTISGLSTPLWPSSAANKKYVDDREVNIEAQIADISIEDLTDVAIMTPAAGKVLTWIEAQSAWSSQTAQGGVTYISSCTDASISGWTSGQVLTWNGTDWANKYPALTFNVANVRLSANTYLNMTQFNTGAGKSCYVLQASCCNSSCASISGIRVQILDDNSLIYETSSSTIKQGGPLAKSNAASQMKIRFMYSGSHSRFTGYKYGNAFTQVVVY